MISRSKKAGTQEFERKTVIEFSDLQKQMAAGHHIDNLEGMALVPKRKDTESDYLVLASDNNANPKQEAMIFTLKLDLDWIRNSNAKELFTPMAQ